MGGSSFFGALFTMEFRVGQSLNCWTIPAMLEAILASSAVLEAISTEPSAVWRATPAIFSILRSISRVAELCSSDALTI